MTISLIMIVGGFKIYSGLLKKSHADLLSQYLEETDVSQATNETPKLIVPMKTIDDKEEVSHKNRMKVSSGSRMRTNNNNLPSSVDFKTSVLPSNMTTGNSSRITSSTSKMSFGLKQEDDQISTTNGAGMALYEKGMRTNGKIASTEGAISLSSGITGISSTATITPPFAAPKTGSGTILVDPSTDPQPQEQIPAGEGLWILLLLAGTYGVYKKMS
jgi:hypothetical protein